MRIDCVYSSFIVSRTLICLFKEEQEEKSPCEYQGLAQTSAQTIAQSAGTIYLFISFELLIKFKIIKQKRLKCSSQFSFLATIAA